MSCDERPELSVVLPVYNEGGNVPLFLRELSRQQGVAFEVIISDGGSSDGSVDDVPSLSAKLPFSLTVVRGPKGRGRQMNLGAGSARAGILLFLHVDSSFPDPLSFRKGIDLIRAAADSGNDRVAAHFSMEFDFDAPPPLPYRYYSAKATLDRPGCTHGDQGLLIDARFFEEIGPFDPALPLMEDTFLAERIRAKGSWLLIPAPIRTSPRRFAVEGLFPRQTLNAIVMNLAAIGRWDLIGSLRDAYRSQDSATRLDLVPFYRVLRREIAALPPVERRELWRSTGRYVRCNAWQIPFFLDVLMGDYSCGKGGKFLALHDRLLGPLIDNAAGDLGAAALVRVWFRLTAGI